MSKTSSNNNKHIAKNSILLFFLMLLTMVVSLYTSRVVLGALGVEYYGIYNVVGGVVAMFPMRLGCVLILSQNEIVNRVSPTFTQIIAKSIEAE